MSGHAVVIADVEGVIRLWSDEAEEMFGHPRDEAIGRSLDLLIPEAFRQYHWPAFHGTMTSGEFHYDGAVLCEPVLHADGSVQPHRGRFMILRNEAGGPIGVLATWAPTLADDAANPGPRVVSLDTRA